MQRRSSREIPIILVAPVMSEEDEEEYSVDPESIAKNVMGNVIVYYPTTMGGAG